MAPTPKDEDEDEDEDGGNEDDEEQDHSHKQEDKEDIDSKSKDNSNNEVEHKENKDGANGNNGANRDNDNGNNGANWDKNDRGGTKGNNNKCRRKNKDDKVAKTQCCGIEHASSSNQSSNATANDAADACGCNKGNTGNTMGSAIHLHPMPADNTTNEAPATTLVGGDSACTTSAFEKVGTLTANNHSVSPSLMKGVVTATVGVEEGDQSMT